MDWKVCWFLSIVAIGSVLAEAPSPADYLLLLDSSDSVRSNNFELEGRFAVQLVKSIYTQENRIGLFTFGQRTHDQFFLNSYNDEQDIIQAIEFMFYSTGDGNVADAINFTITNGFTENNGDRVCMPNIFIVLTHSAIHTSLEAVKLRELLRRKSAQTFVLNMAGPSSSENFANMTNSTARILNIDNFTKLQQSIQELVQQMSSDPLNNGCGKLTSWQQWTRCSVSCGKGTKFRIRHCIKDQETDTDCDADLIEQAQCSGPDCTDPVDGRWANWNRWGACSESCGSGVQIRTRECSAPVPMHGGKRCPGTNTQSQRCSEWNCPDCTKQCPAGGRISQDCEICECSNVTLFGRVKDSTNRPVVNANIFLASRRYKSVANTNEMGVFSVSGICLMNEQVYVEANLHKSKFQVPNEQNNTHWSLNVTLEKYVTAVFIHHPKDKTRMVGQSFSLCCSAVGNPSPTKYAWFKNDIELESLGTNGTLTIASTTLSDGGKYKCSTETLAGVSQSDEAHINIEDYATDTCGSPVSKLDRLPVGCFLSGDTTKNDTIDIGQCGRTRCMTVSLQDNGTCSDWWPNHCCDANEVEEIIIVCKGFSYKSARVKSCTCKPCTHRTSVSGRAFGRNDSNDIPFQFGTVIVNGKLMTRTNMGGFFKFEVPNGAKRVAVSFHDEFLNKFIDITKIVKLNDGEDTYASIVVPLKPEPKPFNTSHPVDFELGDSDNGMASIASLSIQKESFLSDDGSIYRGAAKASIHFTDPRDRNSIDASNGEFVSETPSGDKNPLQTFGMFHMDVSDANGNPLKVHKPVQFTIDASLFEIPMDNNGDPDIALWDYDTNKGIWVENTKLHFSSGPVTGRKLLQDPGQKLTGTMTMRDIRPINLDENYQTTKWGVTGWTNCDHSIPSTYGFIQTTETRKYASACYVKVVIYSDMTLRDKFSLDKGSVTIKAYTKDLNGPLYYGKSEQSMGKDGHACLSVFCDKMIYIEAVSHNNEQLLPAKHNFPPPSVYPYVNNDSFVQFQSRILGGSYECPNPPCPSGPMYYFKDASDCEKPNANSYHVNLAFATKSPNMVHTIRSEDEHDKTLSWYPTSDDRSCYFKVLIKIRETYDIRVIATSYRANITEQFGTHDVGPTPKPLSNNDIRGACLEFRCPGLIKESGRKIYNEPTIMRLNLNSNETLTCTLRVLNPGLEPDITRVYNGGSVTGLKFIAKPGHNYGSVYGVYVNDRPRSDVDNFCRSGDDSGAGASPIMEPEKRPAVEFDCL